MKAFVVAKGTKARFIREGDEWYGKNVINRQTDEEHMFFLEEVVVDPFGNVGTGPQYKATVGGNYAENGWYGFLRDGWNILVHQSQVQVT